MIKIGNLDIDKFYLGDSSDVKIYLGDVKVWPEDVPPTPTYEWKQYNAGDTIPSKLFYGVKLGDPSMDTTSIEFGDYNTGIAFGFDVNSEYGWYAQDMSGEQIDITEYYDETERCFIIYFSDLGFSGMPISYPMPNDSFEFDVQLYQEEVPPTPTGSTCYEIISTPITSYASTTYSSVYSFADLKWYMLNNLSKYEEYGVYDFVGNIASATTYEGKLAVVGTTEYQYSGSSWSVVGTYEDESVTYEIDDTDPSPYVGQELSTTFKIPYADIEGIQYISFNINANDGQLLISLDTYENENYRYEGSERYEGTVTNDGEYFYLSLPSEAPQSIVIESISYWNSTPIHLIFSSKQVSVKYVEKDIPLADVYDTVAEMETAGCPTVGVNEYGVVGNDAYQFDGEDWNSVSNYKLMEKNADGKANVLLCSSSTILSKTETQPSYFNNITDAVIGYCITYIGDSSFYGCSSLSSIDIPNGVTNIGGWAFANCNSLASIDIPNSVTNIGAGAFQGCSSLSSIDIPNGVTNIGNAAFRDCSRLTSIVIPNSVTTINNQTFWGCISLTSCTIPSSVKSIGGHAFYNCNSLPSITIPNGVTSIADYAFASCTSLSSITVDSNNANYSSEDGVLFNKAKRTLVQYPIGNSLTSYSIPSGVRTISTAAFANCRNLTSIDIPNSVTSISKEVFRMCNRLTSVTVNATTPPTLANSNAFISTNNCPIYVPDASVSAYKSATNWKTYASRIKPISSK